MKVCSVSLAALAAAFLTQAAHSQTVDTHVAAAKAAAGKDHTVLFDSLCAPASGPPVRPDGPRPVPDRSTWHYEPVKVFDNLYYIGEKEYSAWAIVTSQGIIVIDTIWSYSVEDEIVGGLKKLGFDPANVIGNDAVQRYITVARECARANLLRLK
jgi:metallo-beta-lactamase class B